MPLSYVRLMLISSLVAILLASAINYIVDPYGVYRFIDREGFNSHKPKAGANSKLAKPYNVQRVMPKTLLLGNSRVEVGMDPKSAQWPQSSLPVYNMSLPGTGIDTTLESLRYAIGVAKLDTIVVGLDFLDFLVDERPGTGRPATPAGPHQPNGLPTANRDGLHDVRHPLRKIKDLASTLFSLNALVDSALTLALQGRHDQPDLTDRGFNPRRDYERVAQIGSYTILFRQVETTYFASYIRGPKRIYRSGTTNSVELDQLRALIKLCRASGMRLLLYIHPYHARMLEGYRIAGLWPAFEEWKRALVKIISEDAAAHPAMPPLELWDFSGYNEITAERVPGESERPLAMHWYWDPGHYKREAGDYVLARMLGGRSNNGPAPATIGVKLSDQAIDRHLSAIREAQQRYAQARGEEVAELEKLAQKVKSRTKASQHNEIP